MLNVRSSSEDQASGLSLCQDHFSQRKPYPQGSPEMQLSHLARDMVQAGEE